MKYAIILFVLILFNRSDAQIITTVAGTTAGYSGDGGPATDAQIGLFGGLSVDYLGNIYIGDGNNSRIRKVDVSTGIINTIAGTGTNGYNGDGIQATAAQLNVPGYVIVDSKGNLYINDGNNYRIRKVDIQTGIISTFAGNGTFGFSGDGGPATDADYDFAAIIFDNSGNMILDANADHRIRMIDTNGIINTIAGTGARGRTGDGGPATLATMNPQGYSIGIDKYNNIYFSDSPVCFRKIDRSTGNVINLRICISHHFYNIVINI